MLEQSENMPKNDDPPSEPCKGSLLSLLFLSLEGWRDEQQRRAAYRPI
jgi:hypothetical protein